MYSAGIDIGSVATKGVLYNGEVTASVIIPTGWSPREASQAGPGNGARQGRRRARSG